MKETRSIRILLVMSLLAPFLPGHEADVGGYAVDDRGEATIEDNIPAPLLKLGAKALLKNYCYQFKKGIIETDAWIGEEIFVNCVEKTKKEVKKIDKVFLLTNLENDANKNEFYEFPNYGKVGEKKSKTLAPYTYKTKNTVDGKQVIRIKTPASTLFCISVGQSG